MSGIIKDMITQIIEERSKGNSVIAQTTKAKFIFKGINPDKYDSNSEDDPVIIEKVTRIAQELNVKL
ncbi:UNVERIFIED_CONTAM: hypothetical protein Cloal_3142 [Acetivibrio alkalicellulosi]